MWCGHVTFLSLNKKVTKEVSIGEALRKCALPYEPHPPHRHPTGENVPIFASLQGENLRISGLQVFKIRNVLSLAILSKRSGSKDLRAADVHMGL